MSRLEWYPSDSECGSHHYAHSGDSANCLVLRRWLGASWRSSAKVTDLNSQKTTIKWLYKIIVHYLQICFSLLGKLVRKAICFACINFSFKLETISSKSTGPIFTIYLPNDTFSICMSVIDLDLFFQFLKGHCHSNKFYGKIWVCAFIQHSGVPKRIAILLLQLKNIQW